MSPLVTIITVNYNQIEITCALLDSIRRQDYQNLEVFVVDNASLENPAALLADRYPEVHFIRSERNLGFAGGNNLAVKESTGDYLFFVNNDAELTTGCIQTLLLLFQSSPRAGLMSPLICFYPPDPQAGDLIQYAGMTPVHPLTARNQTLGKGTRDQGQYSQPRQTAYAHGAAMMASRQVIAEVGPMEENFFLYYEELDWGERIRRAGFEIWIEPRARIYHKESMTVKKLGALKTYYLNRNRVWFMRRNQKGWRLMAFFIFLWLVTVPKNLVSYAIKGDWDTMKAFWNGVWWNFTAKTDT
jgi:hypothetical protein